VIRTGGRDGSIVRCGQPRRGVPTSMHGQLAINLGIIPYSDLSPMSNARSPHISSHALVQGLADPSIATTLEHNLPLRMSNVTLVVGSLIGLLIKG